MYLWKSRHGIFYYRRNGMRKSLNTRKKREAVEKVSQIITKELQRCPVEHKCKSLTLEHAGAEVIINGENLEQELAIAQSITRTKFTTKKIKDVLLVFCKEKTTDGSWTEKTAAENRRIIEHFIDVIGNVTTAKVGYETLNTYKMELIDSGRATQTINKYLSRIGTFFSWMERHGYLEKNYAKGMQLKRTQSAHEDRERFTLEEVGILLSNLEPNKKKPHRYWLPILAYYTGARLNELCQLHCCDVDKGLIDFNDDTPDKRLKNRASKRIVPLHSELIRLGFEEFCDRGGRVFGELTLGRDGYGKNVSRWFKQYRESLGIEYPFHSFRHTFSDELKQALVNANVIDEITGHASKGETMGRYGKRFGVDILKEAVAKIPTIKGN